MTKHYKEDALLTENIKAAQHQLAGAFCDAIIATAELIKAYRTSSCVLNNNRNLEEIFFPLNKPLNGLATPATNEYFKTPYTNLDSHQSGSLWTQNRWRAVYVAGSSGLYHEVAEPIGRKIFKIGSVAVDRIDRRIAEISSQKYAALAEGSQMESEDFDSWSLCRINRELPIKPRIQIEFHQFAWHVRLPNSMTDEDFEDRLRRVLESRSLRAWAQSPEGITYLQARGVDPAKCRRETHVGSSRVRATELYLFCARTELTSLLTAIERVIIDHIIETQSCTDLARC